MITELENDGEESIAVPQNILEEIKNDKSEEKDLKPVVLPVPIERLQCYTDGYKQLALYALICGVVMIIISPLIRKLMLDVK